MMVTIGCASVYHSQCANNLGDGIINILDSKSVQISHTAIPVNFIGGNRTAGYGSSESQVACIESKIRMYLL